MEIKQTRKNKTLLVCLIVTISILPILFLSSCAPLESEWVVNNLFPNLWVFLSNLIAAAVLIALLAVGLIFGGSIMSSLGLGKAKNPNDYSYHHNVKKNIRLYILPPYD